MIIGLLSSERDSSGGAQSAPYRNARKRMRYERSEPRIARRKPQKKQQHFLKSAAVFFVREAARPQILLRKI
jgi:hypothetical protein